VRVIKSGGMRWAGHVAWIGRGEARTGVWWGNMREFDHLTTAVVNFPSALGRPRRRWEDNITIEVGGGGMDWTELSQD
jgi:hypothetical protein